MTTVALDTNLLMLLVVGRASPAFITRHKRLTQYSHHDFNLLVEALERADAIMTTPNTLTEVSNLAGFGVIDPLRSQIYGVLRNFTELLSEHYRPSRLAAAEPEYDRLGIADAAWLGVLDEETVLLTDDMQLYLATARRGLNVINFDHLREGRGGR